MYYGWRGKVGLVFPHTGSAPEHEYHKYLPEGVTINTTRILFERVDPDGLYEMSQRVVDGAALLGKAGQDIIVFPCTTGSLIKGYGYDLELCEQIKAASGVKKAMTTSTALVRALKAVGAKKLVVTTPYSEEVDQVEKKFLEDNGFEVLDIKGLGYKDPLLMPRVTPDMMYNLTKQVECAGSRYCFCQLYRAGNYGRGAYDGTGFRQDRNYKQPGQPRGQRCAAKSGTIGFWKKLFKS